VKHGEQIVHGDKLPEEKIGHNVLCSCGSDNRRKRTLTIEVLPVRKLSGKPNEPLDEPEIEMLQRWATEGRIHDSMLMLGDAIQRRADWPFVRASFRHRCPTFLSAYTVFNGSLPIQYLTERTLNRLSTTSTFRGLLASKPTLDPGTAGRCIGSPSHRRTTVQNQFSLLSATDQ
jgi:hypothetical protein